MSPNREPVRVLQCPQCGGQIAPTETGDVVSCGHCGAVLRLTVGASGNLLAKKVASIDNSTAFLARTEAIKQCKAKLVEVEGLIAQLRNAIVERAEAEQAEVALQEAIQVERAELAEWRQSRKQQVRQYIIYGTIATVFSCIMLSTENTLLWGLLFWVVHMLC